jgi:hypothetical protein
MREVRDGRFLRRSGRFAPNRILVPVRADVGARQRSRNREPHLLPAVPENRDGKDEKYRLMPTQRNVTEDPVFIVTVSASKRWGDAQQNNLNALLHFRAQLDPDEGIKLLDEIAGVVNRYRIGATAPISQSGAQALGDLGKDQQLPLIACELKNANTTE